LDEEGRRGVIVGEGAVTVEGREATGGAKKPSKSVTEKAKESRRSRF